MGEYRAHRSKSRNCYDVVLVIVTPKGERLYEFGNRYGTMREAKQVAALFNKELGVTV